MKLNLEKHRVFDATCVNVSEETRNAHGDVRQVKRLTFHVKGRGKIEKGYDVLKNQESPWRTHLESWLGRPFTLEEIENGFDAARLVGVACRLIVSRRHRYAAWQVHMILPAGDPATQPPNPQPAPTKTARGERNTGKTLSAEEKNCIRPPRQVVTRLMKHLSKVNNRVGDKPIRLFDLREWGYTRTRNEIVVDEEGKLSIVEMVDMETKRPASFSVLLDYQVNVGTIVDCPFDRVMAKLYSYHQ